MLRLHFSGRYKLSGWRFCACAINVKSSVCSETQRMYGINAKGYSLTLLNIVELLCLSELLSRIMAHCSHVICAWSENMPQNLFSSCSFATNNYDERE